jgi:hypothetical protein
MTEDNIIPFPTTYETPPEAVYEPVTIRIEVTTGTGPLWGGMAVCGCLRGGVVFGGDRVDWIAGPNFPATVR